MSIALIAAESVADAVKTTGGAVVVLASPDSDTAAAAAADSASGGLIARARAAKVFTGEHGAAATLRFPTGLAADALVAVGMGDADAFTPVKARELGGKIAAAVASLKQDATVLCDGLDPAHVAEMAMGASLRRYKFDKYHTKKDAADAPSALSFACPDVAAVEAAYGPANALAQGVAFTRDLVNEPANVLTPPDFAARLEELRDLGVTVEVLGDDEMSALGMGSLLGVSVGSQYPARLVVMSWMNGEEGAAPACFVGKGVTFDTGGISIKPAGGMEEMTMDMGGAGVVSGLMKTLALRGAKANVVGLVGLVENMPDGKAQRPGDIVTSMSGQTIEIINTDAEGRLVLADVLWYAQDRFKPASMINLATLTGAIIIALGYEKAGYFSNNDTISERLDAAAAAEGEGLWRMPLGSAYDKKLKSRLADMKNTGGRDAGSITAAQFLQRFVNDTPWAHIDIAGVTLPKDDGPIRPKGASGWGVATLNRYVADYFES